MKKTYIMGCGRSGTTLMLALMSCFEDTFTLVDDARIPGEDDHLAFARIAHRPESHHVIKRSSDAYRHAVDIPSDIDLLYMVRHPLDVLTSTLNYREQTYKNYVTEARWLGEANALRAVLDSDRLNCLVVSYEKLTAAPDATQSNIAEVLGLEVRTPFSRFQEEFKASKDIDDTLNGTRPVNTNSVGRWLDPEHKEHLLSVWKTIEPTAIWFCERFDYPLGAIEEHLQA